MAGYAMYKKTAKSRNPTAPATLIKFEKSAGCNGYTLVDLLFTLALSSILMSLAFPVYRHLLIEARLLCLTERITSAIHYARSEAIRRRDVVILCKSKDRKTCGGQWRDGWIILSGKTKRSEKNSLLRIYPALDTNEFLEWHGSGGQDYVQLNPDGSAYGHNGSFVVCVNVAYQKTMWLIRMSATGRIRLDKEREYRWPCNY
jgi:type IV fimbrial biogenesis protein FimT